jgi:hypothetical protein
MFDSAVQSLPGEVTSTLFLDTLKARLISGRDSKVTPVPKHNNKRGNGRREHIGQRILYLGTTTHGYDCFISATFSFVTSNVKTKKKENNKGK